MFVELTIAIDMINIKEKKNLTRRKIMINVMWMTFTFISFIMGV